MNIGQSGITENEHGEVLKALHFALKMETDGKEFYLDASRKSNNELGKELFRTLAVAEDEHRQKFQEIYQAISQKESWPDTNLSSGTRDMPTIFARSLQKIDTAKMSASPQEFNAIDTALDMENQSRKFYQEQAQKTNYPAGKEFYLAIMAEERGHYLALTDYREYLRDPADWFTTKEHHSLDGA